ncbi:MAG: polynucleotide kinase-phosphatase [Chloroflexota bacterium]
MNIAVPNLSLVVLIGASGAGKSTFARKHFGPTESLSSDCFRGLVSNDETSQAATADAFDVLHYVARKRLAAGHLTVVDATNVQPDARKSLIGLARDANVPAVAIVLNVPEKVCLERNSTRPERDFGPQVVKRHVQQLRRSLGNLRKEGFQEVFVLDSPESVDASTIERVPLWVDKRDDSGPFDIIGDVHGCYEELATLLTKLGYAIAEVSTPDGVTLRTAAHPEGRKAIFLGDLVDRGPASPDVLKLVMGMVARGAAHCVVGNHDDKLMRKLKGREVQLNHGLEQTLNQLDTEPPMFREWLSRFLDRLRSHYVLDQGNLVVAHAGLTEDLHGRASRRVRDFAMYGDTNGETDDYGMPVRLDWARDYRGQAAVIYGHTPVAEPQWVNNTLNVDTGCVFGGSLTALRYPERELVSVPATRKYWEPGRPFLPEKPTAALSGDDESETTPTEHPGSEPLAESAEAPQLTAQQESDAVLDLSDLLGNRFVDTRLAGGISIHEANSAAALEVISRFAVDPRWLIYLPPTMSPPDASALPDVLEYPTEAFEYYRRSGVQKVICEEKHMGSRAILVVCKSQMAAVERFGIDGDGAGVAYTRTGRRFFNDRAIESTLLSRVRAALDAADVWKRLDTTWVCLDAELMPWSAKAQTLIRDRYAVVSAAARASLGAAQELLDRCLDTQNKDDAAATALSERLKTRASLIDRFTAGFRRFQWDVAGVDDLKLAPFHVLASESGVHRDRPHRWHLDLIAELAAADRAANNKAVLINTDFREVELTNDQDWAEATLWWEDLTAGGGEGMVVKPSEFVVSTGKGVVQPAIKCRGRDYMRLVYGPEYTLPEHLERLRSRSVSRKRSLAQREFALGMEALDRFVRRQPLRRVHECVLGVLALESEAVDPRL